MRCRRGFHRDGSLHMLAHMPRLTTHVLDTASGKPAAGMRVELRRTDSADVLADAPTNKDGRLDKPLLEGECLQAGRLRNHVPCRRLLPGARTGFAGTGLSRCGAGARSASAPTATIMCRLLISPFGYSTYRGS